MAMRVTLSRPNLEDPVLEARWEALADAWNAGPFRSWTWVGCLARERYPDPVLAEVHEGKALVGMALFNRRRIGLSAALYLHEAGIAAQDAVFIEHNGMLAVPAKSRAVLAATLREASRLVGRVVLSGVDEAGLAGAQAAGGIVGPLQTRIAPFVCFDQDGGFSRNTRAQLGRSGRSYAASGPITVERAAMVTDALAWLERLLALHVKTWSARGVASGFASEPVQRFHQALIRRGVPEGMVDLLRVCAGEREIGYLLNLRGAGRVMAYQSGFDYAGARPQEKPGLTCHAAAMRQAQLSGAAEYDFLAGDSRYKRSLANDARPLHWFTWQRRLSWPGAAALARRAVGR